MRTSFRNPAKRHEKDAEINKSDREHAAMLAALNSQIDTALFCQNCNAKLKRDAACCHYCGSVDLAIRPIGLPLFSQAAINGACPRCHGTSFGTGSGMLAGGVLLTLLAGVAGAAIAAGIASTPAPVICVTCGARFRRG